MSRRRNLDVPKFFERCVAFGTALIAILGILMAHLLISHYLQ